MSLRWNFPSWAELKEFWAELGHFNCRAESKVTICMSISTKFCKLRVHCIMIITNFNQFHDHLYEFSKTYIISRSYFQEDYITISVHNWSKIVFQTRIEISAHFRPIFKFELRGKGWRRSMDVVTWQYGRAKCIFFF